MKKAKEIQKKILPLEDKEQKKMDRIIEVAFLEGSLQLFVGIMDEKLAAPQETYNAIRDRLNLLTDL